MLTVLCRTNATLSAGCPDTIDIIVPDGPPYRAGDELTCSSNGYPDPTYSWTVDGDPGSTTSTQVLQEGEHEYVCTATLTFEDGTTCTDLTEDDVVTAYSKCQKQYNTIVTILSVCTIDDTLCLKYNLSNRRS